MSPNPNLPKGWAQVALGDVATEYSVRVDNPAESEFERFVGSNHIDRFELTVSRWGNTSEVSSSMKVFQPGDYLVVRRSLYASDFRERAARASFAGVCSGDILTIKEKKDVIADGFLLGVLNTPRIWAYIVANATGSITRRIKWHQLREYEFPLPPLEEQQRIASTLTAVRRAEESYLNMASSLIVANEAIIAALLLQLRGSKPSVRLQEHADIRYGLTVNPERRKATKQIPYLRVANVLRGALDLTEIKTVGKSEDDDAYRLLRGDVLVVEGHADAAQIGRAAVWKGEVPEMFHQNHLIRIRSGGSLDPEYLCLLANSSHGRAYFRSHAKSSSGLNTINSTVVKQWSIPVPPRDSQAIVVEKARMGALLSDDIARRHTELTQIRSAVLSRLEAADS
jgi:restriction endonuclease S subunit